MNSAMSSVPTLEPAAAYALWAQAYPPHAHNPVMLAEQRAMLDSVTTAVDGGRIFSTSLATVLITDDGRVLAGAVPADRLVEAAATGR